MSLNVGLIGCGGITKVHVNGWKTIPERARIVAVADVSEENAQIRAAEIGGDVAIYRDFAQLLADPLVDAVDIALPHHLHRDAIVAAAQAGKHVMTEKPLCLSLDEAADIAQAVKASGIVFMAGHNQIFYPAVLQAKNMLLRGDLGQVYAIHSIDSGARRAGLSQNKATWGEPETAAEWGWRNDPTKMGGGELIDTGYHPTYRLLFLAGAKPVQVTGMLGNYRLPLTQEDSAIALVKFDNGVTGHILTSWAMRSPGARPMLFAIMGEKGQLWGEPDKLYYQPVGFQTPSVMEFPGFTGSQTFAAEIAHFADAIEHGYEPLHSVAEATETLRVILGAYEAVASQRIVTL